MRFQCSLCILSIFCHITAADDDLLDLKQRFSREFSSKFLRNTYCNDYGQTDLSERWPGFLSETIRLQPPCPNARFVELEKYIISNNANVNSTVALRFYPESLLSQKEFAQRRLGFIPQALEAKIHWRNNRSKRQTDEYLNYVDLGYVTSAKDQENCGSCYSFTAMAVLESALLMKYGKMSQLSVQQGIDCTYSLYEEMNFGCNGGHPYYVLMYAEKFNIVHETRYSYKSRLQACAIKEQRQRLKVTAVVIGFDYSDEDLKQVLHEFGPVSVTVAVGDSSFKHYAGGIITECGTQPDHAVLLVGYKDTAQESYWIVKNSWGSQWGENGFARIQMRSSCSLTLDNPVGVLLGNN